MSKLTKSHRIELPLIYWGKAVRMITVRLPNNEPGDAVGYVARVDTIEGARLGWDAYVFTASGSYRRRERPAKKVGHRCESFIEAGHKVWDSRLALPDPAKVTPMPPRPTGTRAIRGAVPQPVSGRSNGS
ncbi:MAG: hypothetical protein COA38_20445 [Fluviicola sp.]|nr:MAG: hypothetical protein COA38_20445 [Fluviicola sp.]